MNYETERAEVPGLEGVAARKGTAIASLIGSANYWHQRFQEVQTERRKLQALIFLGGVAFGAMLSFAAASRLVH